MSVSSAVTVSLVEQARGGPFVYWDDLAAACEKAADLGFDAIEIFAPSPTAVDAETLKSLLEKHSLKVAAVGTGAGMVIHGLSLIDTNPEKRAAAKDFVKQMIGFGAPYQAPAIIGSMQGKWGGELSKEAGLKLLADALNELGAFAESQGVPLIYEPLNRYETNLINTVAEGVKFLETLSTKNVKLLADLFHMNIEEADLAEAIRAGEGAIGHIHFVDSNRKAAGMGHMTYEPIIQAIKDTNYDGYLSVEAFPLPNPDATAKQTIETFRKYFR